MKYIAANPNNWVFLRNTHWVFILEEGKYRQYKKSTMAPAEIWDMLGVFCTLDTVDSGEVSPEEYEMLKKIQEDLEEYVIHLQQTSVKMLEIERHNVSQLRKAMNTLKDQNKKLLARYTLVCNMFAAFLTILILTLLWAFS